MEPYSEFGDLINEYLMTREMSGAQLARRLEVSTSTVNRWRNGQARPKSPEQLIRLADLLGTYGETRGRLLQSVGYGAVIDASDTLSSGDEVTPNANEEQPVAVSIRYPTDTSTWQQYPSTYRQAEMTILAKWIEIGASGVVQGLAGCGVSTLLRYFCNRPKVVSTDHSSNKQIIMPIWIDLHPLTEPTVPTLYRLLLRSMLESAYRLADQLPSELLRECEAEMDDTDSFNLQTTLFRLFSHCQSNQIKVVAVFDRVDQIDKSFFAEIGTALRSVRDRYRETLIYLFGLRISPTHFETIYALGDLGRLLSTHRCTVGCLTGADSYFVIQQRTADARVQPSEPEIRHFLTLSGGYPTLLKAVIRWWQIHEASIPQSEWLDRLQREPSIQLRLREIWDCLSEQEQDAVQLMQNCGDNFEGVSPSEVEQTEIFNQLEALGICRRIGDHRKLTATLFQQMQ